MAWEKTGFDMCSDCGEDKPVDDEFLCEECAAEYAECEGCGAINRPENMRELLGHVICLACIELE